MTTNRDRAVEVMRNFWHDGRYAVGFDEIADALAAAGVLADDLPAPSLYAYESQDNPMWDTCNHFRADALDSPRVALSKAGNVWKMTPDEARSLALALLAAADHAETEVTDD